MANSKPNRNGKKPKENSDNNPEVTPSSGIKPGTKIGKYAVEKLVARGGMASVLSVKNTETDQLAAMKLLTPLAEEKEAKLRFRREFRALSRLSHPNLLRVYEWGIHGNRPWFTMELIHGKDLREMVTSFREMEPIHRFARVESILIQMARVLSYIHDRGIIHRDITPGNIMIGPDDQVKLTDFGVVKELDADMTVVGEVIGTAAYIAPEQIRGDSLDARADLYSLGCVLYLMLTGRRLFSAQTIHGLMEKQLHQVPKPPRQVDPLVPDHLNSICERLLSKDPDDRYASASHLLHVLGDVSSNIVGGEDWLDYSVGRPLLRARLRETIDELLDSQHGKALLIQGESGQGKTRMLQLANGLAQRRGLTVVHGRCKQHDRPFGGFVGVFNELGSKKAPRILKNVFSGKDDDGVQERYPILKAFRAFLLKHTPCVIVIDELEHADTATLELLQYLVRNTLELETHPVLFVLANQNPSKHVLGDLFESDVVHSFHIGPLNEAEVEELIVSVLGHNPASLALARRLHSESGGLPAYITEMLRGLREDGLIIEQEGSYILDADVSEISESRLPMPDSLRQVLQDRLAPLAPNALETGRLIALARRNLNVDALIEVSSLDEESLIDALDDLVDAQIVEEIRSFERESVRLSHRRFRDVFLENLDTKEQRKRHGRLGEVLEQQHRIQHSEVVEELAYHFEQAGLAPKAYTYLLRTAHLHLNRSSYAEALVFLKRALAMEPIARPNMLLEESDRMLAELYLAKAQVHYHLGDWDKALESIQQTEVLSNALQDLSLQSRVSGLMGQYLRNMGRPDDAEPHLKLALKKARKVGDESLLPEPLYQYGAVLWGRGLLDKSEELWTECLETAVKINDPRSQGWGLNALGILAICKGASMEARRHLEQSSSQFEQLGMLGPLSISQFNLAELSLATGNLRKALSISEKLVAQSREVHHRHGISLGLVRRSEVLLGIGRFDEAEENAKEAIRLLTDLGQGEDQIVALASIISIYLAKQDFVSALTHLDECEALLTTHDTQEIGSQPMAWRIIALVNSGNLDGAKELAKVGRPADEQWPHRRVPTDLAWGYAYLAIKDEQQAQDVLQRALTTAEENGYRFYQLRAHDALIRTDLDTAHKSRHVRVSRALARSLAANLTRDDSVCFLAKNWGESLP